jgi:serine/threonine protein kinase
MTTKAAFSPEEWKVVLEGPPAAGMIVVTAARGGTFRETIAMAKAYTEARAEHGDSELLDEIVATKPEMDRTRYHSAEELRDNGLAHLRSAVALLESKASPGELGDYRRFVVSLAGKVAAAHREHGQAVSPAEAEAIQRAYLGVLDAIAADSLDADVSVKPTGLGLKLHQGRCRELIADPRHVERFIREVRVASALDSPHVVRVLEAATPSDGLPFLAMERLRGHTLGELLRTTNTLTGVDLAELLAQIGRAFETARIAGVVHRDVKPHNLFRADDGSWKVLDFGVAALADSSSTLTQGGVIGTPAYMSPEQARGEPVDHRADVYALGAVIYRCVTGRVPFAAADTPSLLHAVIHDMPLRPSAIARVDGALDRVLMLALAKARDARLSSAAELVAAYDAATTGTLPDALVRRARTLARRHPWTEPAA